MTTEEIRTTLTNPAKGKQHQKDVDSYIDSIKEMEAEHVFANMDTKQVKQHFNDWVLVY